MTKRKKLAARTAGATGRRKAGPRTKKLATRKKPAAPAMTPATWLACTDPVPMVEFVRECPRASPRVWRLFLAAFWGWQSHRHKTPAVREDLRRRVGLVEEWAETGKEPPGVAAEWVCVFFGQQAFEDARHTAAAPRSWGRHGEEGKAASAIQPQFLRDLFGPHPFRRVTAHSDWLTSTVVALAKGIYEDRAFGAMPILGDALQDAGCDDADVLNHCRHGGGHVRGCWVLDILPGKS